MEQKLRSRAEKLARGISALLRLLGAACAQVMALLLWPFARIASALQAYFRFQFRVEYAGTFDNGHANHIESLAKNFYLRGRQLMAISLLLALCISILVVLGVGTFLFPQTFSDVGAGESQELTIVQQRLQDILRQQKAADEQRHEARQSYLAISLLDSAFRVASRPVDLMDRDQNWCHAAQMPISDSDKDVFAATIALLDPAFEEEISFNFENARYEKLNSIEIIETGTIASARTNFQRKTGMALDGLVGKLRELLDSEPCNDELTLAHCRNGRLITTDADSQEPVPEPSPCGESRLRLYRDVYGALDWVPKEVSPARITFEQLDAASEQFVELRHEQAVEILALQTHQAELIAEGAVSEVEGAGRWLRVLAVRVGAIILFLFLARIFLETYRYTIALSAFYRARGDALQLIGKGTSKNPMDTESLGKTLIALAPENYRIDKVWSPESLLLQLISPHQIKEPESQQMKVDKNEPQTPKL